MTLCRCHPLLPPDPGPGLDMKLLAAHQPRRRPSAAERRRTIVRALFYAAMMVLAAALLVGYGLATMAIGVDHRRWVWWWIGLTFALAGLIFLVCWLVERRGARRGLDREMPVDLIVGGDLVGRGVLTVRGRR